jgi:hypothetical protein
VLLQRRVPEAPLENWRAQENMWESYKVVESGTASDGAAASAPLQHPCPICLGTEAGVGSEGMCFSCGQMFCGPCSETFNTRGIRDCPTCRAPLSLAATEKIRRLRRLLTRSDGRVIQGAQFSIGTCYDEGAGVAQDQAEACGAVVPVGRRPRTCECAVQHRALLRERDWGLIGRRGGGAVVPVGR